MLIATLEVGLLIVVALDLLVFVTFTVVALFGFSCLFDPINYILIVCSYCCVFDVVAFVEGLCYCVACL